MNQVQNQVKISIIVPVYNAEMFLEESLKSLVSQTEKEIEIICVNDGSTDKSEQILKNYQDKDKRIRVINQEIKPMFVDEILFGKLSDGGEVAVTVNNDKFIYS